MAKCQEIQSRIVGGFNVTSLEGFMHQVSIRLVSSDRTFGNGHRCGGSLISHRTVLTAGLNKNQQCTYLNFVNSSTLRI